MPADPLDRAEQRRDAQMELRHTDPEAWRQQLAERNREVHRRHVTESKGDLIDQINKPIGR